MKTRRPARREIGASTSISTAEPAIASIQDGDQRMFARMTAPLRIAIAGLGTVGAGTIKLLQVHAADLARRCERPIEIAAVAASMSHLIAGMTIHLRWRPSRTSMWWWN